MADVNSGWMLGQFGAPSQSTMPLSPQQTAQIQNTTAAMQQPMQQTPDFQQPWTQQNQMLKGLMGGGAGQAPGTFVPTGGQIPGALGPTSVNGAPISMGPMSVGGAPLGY